MKMAHRLIGSGTIVGVIADKQSDRKESKRVEKAQT